MHAYLPIFAVKGRPSLSLRKTRPLDCLLTGEPWRKSEAIRGHHRNVFTFFSVFSPFLPNGLEEAEMKNYLCKTAYCSVVQYLKLLRGSFFGSLLAVLKGDGTCLNAGSAMSGEQKSQPCQIKQRSARFFDQSNALHRHRVHRSDFGPLKACHPKNYGNR